MVKPQGKVFTTILNALWEAIREKRSPEDTHWLDKAKPKFGNTVVEDIKTALKVLKVFLPLPLFWAIFFQIYSVWTAMAGDMNRDFTINGSTFTVPPGEVAAINPLLDIALIPLTAKVVYPFIAKQGIQLTDLRKMGAGLVFTSLSLLVTGFVQLALEQGQYLSCLWIIPQVFLVSCAEVLTSVTAYEFAYTQAPKNMKGMLTAGWLLTIAGGNVIISILGLANIQAQAMQSFVLAGVLALVFLWFLYIAKTYQYTVNKEREEEEEEEER